MTTTSVSLSVPPYVAVLDMVFAAWNAVCISAAADLGVADHLESGPKTTTELAALTNVHEDSLYRLLRALAGVGIFHEGENRTFSQTPRSDVLRTHAKPSLRYAAPSMLDRGSSTRFKPSDPPSRTDARGPRTRSARSSSNIWDRIPTRPSASTAA
jgi:hypothetical protein